MCSGKLQGLVIGIQVVCVPLRHLLYCTVVCQSISCSDMLLLWFPAGMQLAMSCDVAIVPLLQVSSFDGRLPAMKRRWTYQHVL